MDILRELADGLEPHDHIYSPGPAVPAGAATSAGGEGVYPGYGTGVAGRVLYRYPTQYPPRDHI